MRCTTCGAGLRPVTSDLPFKIAEHTIVILKGLPVLQCGNCGEFLIEDVVQARVDELLGMVNETAELEVIRYAA
jgi:YgiT-type zinc finger domain-containing protein